MTTVHHIITFFNPLTHFSYFLYFRIVKHRQILVKNYQNKNNFIVSYYWKKRITNKAI